MGAHYAFCRSEIHFLLWRVKFGVLLGTKILPVLKIRIYQFKSLVSWGTLIKVLPVTPGKQVSVKNQAGDTDLTLAKQTAWIIQSKSSLEIEKKTECLIWSFAFFGEVFILENLNFSAKNKSFCPTDSDDNKSQHPRQ